MVYILAFFMAVLSACGGSPEQDEFFSSDELSSESSENSYAEHRASREAVTYVGKFEYTLTECQGYMADKYNQTKKQDFFQMRIERDNVHLLRPEFVDSMKVRVKAIYQPVKGELLRMNGNFGIADKEDWRSSEGRMILSRDSVEGQIHNIMITHNISESEEMDEGAETTSCKTDLRFSGTAIDAADIRSA